MLPVVKIFVYDAMSTFGTIIFGHTLCSMFRILNIISLQKDISWQIMIFAPRK